MYLCGLTDNILLYEKNIPYPRQHRPLRAHFRAVRHPTGGRRRGATFPRKPGQDAGRLRQDLRRRAESHPLHLQRGERLRSDLGRQERNACALLLRPEALQRQRRGASLRDVDQPLRQPNRANPEGADLSAAVCRLLEPHSCQRPRLPHGRRGGAVDALAVGPGRVLQLLLPA